MQSAGTEFKMGRECGREKDEVEGNTGMGTRSALYDRGKRAKIDCCGSSL